MKFIAFLLYFSTLSLFSQSVRVEGNLVADKDAVSIGQITLYSLPDSTLRKGSYLDSNFFKLELNARKRTDFYAKIAIPGYLDTLIDFKVKKTDSVIDLGLIMPTKNKNLETVDIVFRKEMFTRTMDGISVNVEGTSLQNLTNLFDVLKASPKITSPDDERIEIIGRGSPLILVDRQAIISNDELKAIPANQIERIEIITNPSAKYKAQGSGNGIIEVYTKNFHLEGYNMTVRATAGVNTQLKPTGGMNLGLSWKKKKMTLNAYLGGNYNSGIGFNESEGRTTDDSQRSLASNYQFENDNIWQYYRIKGAYSINERARLSFGINGHGSSGNSNDTSSTSYKINEELITQSVSKSSSGWTWLNNSAFVNYTLETDTNRSNLEINLNYVNKLSNSDSKSTSDFEYLPTGEKSAFAILNDSKDIPNIGELRVNYEHYFDTTGWKLGVGGSYSALINGKRLDRYNNEAGEWVIDPVNSNSYDYQEHIGAVFVELSKKWKKIGFRVGVRGEYTKLDGFSNSLNQQFMDSAYILPFPSASILYEPNPKLGITLFYDSGIDRPQFSNYDPFVVRPDSLSIRYGNPFLRPAIEQSVGLDFDLFYAYNVSVTYSFTQNPVSSYSFINEESFLTETTAQNAKSQEGISASLSIPFQTKWLQGWNSIWVDYSKYSFTSVFGREPLFNVTYGVYSYLTFTLPKNFEITNRFHVNKWGEATSVNNVTVNWGLRATKKFNGNKFQIFADVGNIIPPRNKSTTYSGNYIYESTSQNRFTTFKLGVFLKFGRLKASAQIKESTSGQSDRL